MPEKRMFTKKITESDAFLDMPLSSQCLYFHLNMSADDDGFVNNPKRILRTIGASEDDLKLLIAKAFVLVFESGVIVIKHWRMHNTLQNDRYHPTDYQEEFSLLGIKDNKSYTWKQNGNILETEHNVTKPNETKQRFVPPTLEEVTEYCLERKNNVDPKKFYEYYSVANWKDAKGNPVKNWKQKMIANWEKDKPKEVEKPKRYEVPW